MDHEISIPFLIRAKQHTYAGGGILSASSRPASHDLEYGEGDWRYLDTYLGAFHFIGEEAVWQAGVALWGMNYYGKMLVEQVPNGFGKFLKEVLMRVPTEAPFRGPEKYQRGSFAYHCSWEGSQSLFEGWEEIHIDERPVYRLLFHGGEIHE
jgi:hypothetical protein